MKKYKKELKKQRDTLKRGDELKYKLAEIMAFLLAIVILISLFRFGLYLGRLLS